MPGDNVRLAVYARLSDGLVLASHKGRATDAAKDTAKKVLESGNLKPNAQLTVTVTPEIGTLHLTAGDADVVAVITATEYPRRAAFKLLDEIRGQVSEAGISAEDVAGASKEGALKFLPPVPERRVLAIRGPGGGGQAHRGGGAGGRGEGDDGGKYQSDVG